MTKAIPTGSSVSGLLFPHPEGVGQIIHQMVQAGPSKRQHTNKLSTVGINQWGCNSASRSRGRYSLCFPSLAAESIAYRNGDESLPSNKM
jgi:hypothetical protein